MRLPSRRHVLELVRKERRQLLRDPRTRMIVFVAPVVQLIVFGYAVNTDIRDVATVVVDHDVTPDSRRLVDAFTASGRFRVTERGTRSATTLEALERGDAVVGLEIPAGFAADLAAGRSPAIQLLVDGTNSNTGTVALGYANRIVQRFAAEAGSGLAVRHGLEPLPAGVELRDRAWYNPGLRSRDYNVPAVIGAVLMLMCLLLTSLAVAREREAGTLEQLMVTPLTPAELMLGKTLPVSVVGLIDLGLVTTVAVAWFRIPFRGSVLALLAAALLYIVAGLAFGLLISTVSKTQQEAFMTMFLFFLPAIILAGFLYPVHTMPALFRWLSVLDPVRHFLTIVRSIFLKGEGVAGLWPEYLILAAMAVGALGLAVMRFRRSLA
ncbi:MAG TPA: ABC transporter permease [Gemmatimonadota bacterium]|nr:ABC transporter permease [Gemmatimonadota bacterium]